MEIQLGVLEEIVLMLLLMKEESYGVAIAKEYEHQFQRPISLPAIHVVLKRLEKKGLVTSRLGEPTPERGGKRKRVYEATYHGYQVASDMQQKRNDIWKLIPKFSNP